ncbi:hypothetical protein FRC09_020195 [Ceratobasidium sp. 395]|nr:hypothetical protein FRC09_020195 [Ceratobasidium sp. 395]
MFAGWVDTSKLPDRELARICGGKSSAVPAEKRRLVQDRIRALNKDEESKTQEKRKRTIGDEADRDNPDGKPDTKEASTSRQGSLSESDDESDSGSDDISEQGDSGHKRPKIS